MNFHRKQENCEITVDYQADPVIAGDHDGGAMITWYDSRDATTDYDIYAQHVDALGAMQCECIRCNDLQKMETHL
ncbi:MAG: hypothetical protein ACTSRS_07465 [Candidatus Helarchaeota archaeon]